MKKLTEIPSYRIFLNKKDQAVEELLRKAVIKLSDEYAHIIHIVRDQATVCAHRVVKEDLVGSHSAVRDMENSLKMQFHHIARRIEAIRHRLRQSSFALSYAAEMQAIHQVGIGKHPHPIGTMDLMKKLGAPKYGDISARTRLCLNRIIRKATDAIELGVSMGEDPGEMVQRVLKTFKAPQKRKTIKALRRLTEARRFGIDTEEWPEFISEADWNSALADYKEEYVPQWRDPRTSMGEITEDGEHIAYGWEVEQEATEELVANVIQAGLVAANDQKITDFIWVSVIDNVTDECCIWRDGLLLSEIESRLSEHEDEDCDGTVPPIHFNCRCRIVAATENLPEVPEDNAAEFDAWLNS
jgi:hypothetical protein